MKKLSIIIPLFVLTLKAQQPEDILSRVANDVENLSQSMNQLFSTLHALGSNDFPIETERKSSTNATITQDDGNIIVTININDKKEMNHFYNPYKKNLTIIINCKEGILQAEIDKDFIDIEQKIGRQEEIKGENGVIQKITTNAFHSRSNQSLPEQVNIANYSIEERDQHVIITLPKVISQKK